MTTLHPPSSEQQEIISAMKNSNVIVNAVAGSGKTTTALHIAKQYPQDSILLLTYNKRLKQETRDKISALGLRNIEAHSYHAMCYKYFGGNTGTDKDLLSALSRKLPPKSEINYSVVVIDEAQDITKLFFKFIHYVLSHNLNRNCRLCMLGDRYQSIFTFNGADPRYLTLANKVFNVNDFPWKQLNLSVTFRVPPETVAFVNKFAMKRNYMTSHLTRNDKSRRPVYVVDNTFDINSDFLISEFVSKYKYSDIFILAPSIKSDKTPVRKFANKLSVSGFPVYIPVSDDEKIDEDVISGKIVISTFHQVKGLERPLVILFNFDNSYFEYFKKNERPDQCTNDLYVAMTRTSDRLVLIHHYTNKFLKFLLPVDEIDKFTDFRVLRRFKTQKNASGGNPNEVKITDLTRYTPYDIINDCYSRIQIKQTRERCDPSNDIKLPNVIEQDSGTENVQEINNLAMLLWYEFKQSGEINSLKHLESLAKDSEVASTLKHHKQKIARSFQALRESVSDSSKNHSLNCSHLLYLANIINMVIRGYVFKVNQITSFSWLKNDTLEKASERISSVEISRESEFNKHVSIRFANYTISGTVDCSSSDEMFKIVSAANFKPDVVIQALVQKYCEHGFENIKKCKIYNIMTDELVEISATMEDTEYILQTLLQHKFHSGGFVTDDEFTDGNSVETAPAAKSETPKSAVSLVSTKSTKTQLSELSELLRIVHEISPENTGQVLVLDTETIGFPKGPRDRPDILSNYDNARMIELAYQIFSPSGEMTKQMSRLVKPVGFVIKNSKIHGITHKSAKENGAEIAEVMKEFAEDLKSVDVIVAHNLEFDKCVLLSEFHRLQDLESVARFKSKSEACTMKQGAKKFNTGQRIKLTKLYKKLFGKEFLQDHRALSDVKHCADCYWAMNPSE